MFNSQIDLISKAKAICGMNRSGGYLCQILNGKNQTLSFDFFKGVLMIIETMDEGDKKSEIFRTHLKALYGEAAIVAADIKIKKEKEEKK